MAGPVNTFGKGFTRVFTAKGMGNAMALLLVFAILVWAGFGARDLAAQIPFERPF